MQTLIIHIGAHKTGTTALQSAFASHMRELRTQGVLYPKTNWYHFSQHRLAFAVKGRRDSNKNDIPDLLNEVNILNREISKSKQSKIFISSEEFFSCPQDKIRQMADMLAVDCVEIIATIRRPDELLLSIYNQNAKQCGNKFSKSLQVFTKSPRTLHKDMLQYDCIKNWCNVFGKENLHLIQYEAGSTIDQVCAYLGIPAEILGTGMIQANKSVPGIVAEIMRLSKANDMSVEKRRKLFRICTEIFSDAPKLNLSNQDRREVLSVFEAENDRMFEMFGQENPYRVDIIPEEDSTPQRQNLTFREMVKLIDHLLT